jgi:hypothetical protein
MGLFIRYLSHQITLNAPTDFIKNIPQHRDVIRLPSEEDLNGAAVALMRLQDTYKLDTHALANGNLLGKKYSRQLTGIYSYSDSKSLIATFII